jgi:hypothetical protein
MWVRTALHVTGALLLTLLVASCDEIGDGANEVRGSGKVVTEPREVSGFDEVVLTGFGDVIVEVTGTESLTIEAEDNILPLLTSEVISGRLELGARQSADQQLSPTRDVVFRITATELVGTSVLGSGNVVVSGVEAPSFSVSIAGSGEVSPEGTCDSLAVDISGSGAFNGEGLVARAGTVAVSGSGTSVVNATDELEVTVSGSGLVEYLGTPTVQRTVTGSGDVRPR